MKYLFDMPRPELIMEIQDMGKDATDDLDRWLLRRGWTQELIDRLRQSIHQKRTPDMFTNELEPLDIMERHFQRAIEVYQKGI